MNRIALGLGITAVTMLAACGSTISNSNAGSTSGPTSTPNSLTGPIGTAFTDTDSTNDVMTVTLTAVQDPAVGSDQFDQPDAGNRFVAAKFTLVGKTGAFSDDANSDATLIGSDSQTYQPDFDNVNGCTNFNSGSFTVTPGETSIGCVVFQVPSAIKVKQIQWGSEFSTGAPAVWTVS
jgi:hypothetical protein